MAASSASASRRVAGTTGRDNLGNASIAAAAEPNRRSKA